MTRADYLLMLISVGTITAVILLTKWTDSKGWTQFRRRGNGRKAVSIALSGWDQYFRPEFHEAVEYQKTEHAEEDHSGEDKDPNQLP